MKNVVNRALAAKSKTNSMLIASILKQENMVSQIYDGTRLKLFTKERHMQAGETRTFDLTMVEDFENFEGHEVIRETYKRNPTVFQGAYINVHRDKQGHYPVTLRKLELKKGFNVSYLAIAIRSELLTAKKFLGL